MRFPWSPQPSNNTASQFTQLLSEMKTMAENQADLDTEITVLQSQDATLQTALQAISANILGQIANLQQKLATGQDFTPEIASLTNVATDLGNMDTSAQALQAQADAAANPVIANPIAGSVPQPVASASGTDATGAPAPGSSIPDDSATTEPVAVTPGAAPETTPGMPIAPGSGATIGDQTANMVTPPSAVTQ